MSSSVRSVPVDLASLAEAAAELRPLAAQARQFLLRPEAVDRILVRAARGRGALDAALAEGLAAISRGDRLLRLGYSCLADYARERLDVAGRTAEALVRLGRGLPDRPLLREALRSGRVTLRKAQSVLAVARGEEEAVWVARAGRETVRALDEAVRKALERAGADGAQACADEGEGWHRARLGLSPESRAVVDEAMALAGQLVGPAAPPWQRVEAICQEYLGFAAAAAPERGEPVGCAEGGGGPDLERLLDEWTFLEGCWTGSPVAAPDTDASPRALDDWLRALATVRDTWDELVGSLALALRQRGQWRELGFASFAHYCRERLQLPVRSVEQRVWLLRRLDELPELRQALRERRVGYEKARIVAGVATPADCAAWVARAEDLTCIALRREVEAAEAAQPCAEPGITLRMPERVATLLGEAFRTVRRVEGRKLTASQCLVRLCEHFVASWRLPRQRSTPQRRALARDRWLCQVPGCSRAAVHAHHIAYRSQGGEDDPANLVALCAAHHLHGVHRGFVRVWGRAPDGLVWQLGERGQTIADAA